MLSMSRSKGKQLMSRYRKTIGPLDNANKEEDSLSNMQIAILKKEYAPFKGKTITSNRKQNN